MATSTPFLTSPDGVNWTPAVANLPASQIVPGSNIVWNPTAGLFMYLNSSPAEPGGHGYQTSPDGVTWTDQNAPNSQQLTSAIYSPTFGLTVAGSQVGTGNLIVTTPDDLNFTGRETDSAATPNHVIDGFADSGSLVIACGLISLTGGTATITGNLWSSTTPGTWTAITSGMGGEIRSVATDGTNWAIFGANATNFGIRLTTTPTVGTWTNATTVPWSTTSGATAIARRVIAPSGKPWVLVGKRGVTPFKTVMTAPAGSPTVWTEQTSPFDGSTNSQGLGIAYSPTLGLYCAVGNGSSPLNAAMIATSPDGATWTVQVDSTHSGGVAGVTGWQGNAADVTWSSTLGLFVASGLWLPVAPSGTPGWRIGRPGVAFNQNTAWAVR